jgi:beta-glucuronidase
MKKKIFFALLVMACTLGVEGKTCTQIGNVMARKTTSLNGPWNYIVDVQEEGYYDYRMNVTRWDSSRMRSLSAQRT